MQIAMQSAVQCCLRLVNLLGMEASCHRSVPRVAQIEHDTWPRPTVSRDASALLDEVVKLIQNNDNDNNNNEDLPTYWFNSHSSHPPRGLRVIDWSHWCLA